MQAQRGEALARLREGGGDLGALGARLPARGGGARTRRARRARTASGREARMRCATARAERVG